MFFCIRRRPNINFIYHNPSARRATSGPFAERYRSCRTSCALQTFYDAFTRVRTKRLTRALRCGKLDISFAPEHPKLAPGGRQCVEYINGVCTSCFSFVTGRGFREAHDVRIRTFREYECAIKYSLVETTRRRTYLERALTRRVRRDTLRAAARLCRTRLFAPRMISG